MPVLKRKYDSTKVYRPNGTRYAKAEWHNLGKVETCVAIYSLVNSLKEAFDEEFGCRPEGTVVFEFVVHDGGITGTMFEIKD